MLIFLARIARLQDRWPRRRSVVPRGIPKRRDDEYAIRSRGRLARSTQFPVIALFEFTI